MLGTFPTWFQIRERGKQYALAVRVQMFEPEIWGHDYDRKERLYLTKIHQTLMDRCNVDRNLIRPIDPEYDWYLDNGLRYYYYTYPIPFPWRQPFLDWLNETIGPDGVKPNVPHNIPDPNADNGFPWGRTYNNTWTEAVRTTAPRTPRTPRANPRLVTPRPVTNTPATWTVADWTVPYVAGFTGTGGINGGNNGGGTL